MLVKAGAKDLAETGVDAVEPVLRGALASQARVEAAKATKTATKKMATNKLIAAAWKRASSYRTAVSAYRSNIQGAAVPTTERRTKQQGLGKRLRNTPGTIWKMVSS